MVICICSNLNEQVIQDLIDIEQNLDVFEVHEKLNACIGCGTCLPTIFNMIEKGRENVSEREI
jgi:bacterioferritin-associated ferredoxin